MKKLNIIFILIAFLSLNAQALFEIKDASDNTVLEVAEDGLRIFNLGDTLMVISSTEIKAFIDDSAKDKALSRSFSVTTSASKGDSKMFKIQASDGATFYNPDDTSDEILKISKNSITANVNPGLNRDFIVNDEVSGKGSGNLMKISNEAVFEVVNDSTMLWYKDKNAFRIGYVYINDPNTVGRASFASGYKSQASGNFSSALGKLAQVTGESAFASGEASWATGDYSCAIGKDAHATNTSAFAVGTSTQASGESSFAAGFGNTASGKKSSALGMGSIASAEYATAIGAICIANQYGSTGIGIGSWATGYSSTALGSGARASNNYSIALSGRLAEASGYGSTAIGYYTDAIGNYSTALGYYTEAEGTYTTATGYYTDAVGNYSTAMGRNTEARQYCSFAIGRYNTVGGSSTSWVSTDALFLIGNGSSTSSRSDAMKVKKNGQIFFPSVYSTTSSNSRKDLKIDSNGMLCVLSAKEKGYTDEDVVEVIKENMTLRSEVEELKSEIEEIKRLLNK